MTRYGVMRKADSSVVYVYTYNRQKTFPQYSDSTAYTQFEFPEGTDARAYSWNGIEVVFDSEWVNPIDYTNTNVTNSIRAGAVAFGVSLINDFTTENISMGITATGKSGNVLGFAEHPVVVGSNTFGVSLKSAAETGTLTVLVQILDHHIANIGTYPDMSPFVTVDRLNGIKAKVNAFLQG